MSSSWRAEPGRGSVICARARARSVRAGDITPGLVAEAKAHYGDRLEITEMDAAQIPLPDQSLDVILLLEAIYYLPSIEQFLAECKRVLRPGGRVLVATANKDLFDFNPSPFSVAYYGVVELERHFGAHGFSCEFFGNVPLEATSLRQRVLRPIKKLVVSLNLMPRTMAGKRLLKRLVFGALTPMPREITAETAAYVPPTSLPKGAPDRRFKVIYMAATLPA